MPFRLLRKKFFSPGRPWNVEGILAIYFNTIWTYMAEEPFPLLLVIVNYHLYYS